MNFFERRAWRKRVKHLLHEARHIRYTREDIAPAADIAALREAERGMEEAFRRGADAAALDKAAGVLVERAHKIMPPRADAGIRELVEIVIVAAAVALGGFRCYFLQPFKIPTGSMQPTLNGIIAKPAAGPAWRERFPLSLANWLVTGEWYTEVRAKASGQIQCVGHAEGLSLYVIAGVKHLVRETCAYTSAGRLVDGRRSLKHYFREGDFIQKGQLLASGVVRRGDFVFVNKLAYNFGRPERGDIIVFSTADVRYPNVRTNNFYIKRLVGLPGESIRLDPPYLVANGRRIEEPYPFYRLVHEVDKGYAGYQLPEASQGVLGVPGSELRLGPKDYLPFGDNTRSSLDGRYFGPVREEALVGPALMVYWPFGPHWGLVQ